jgi:hypothetical protein
MMALRTQPAADYERPATVLAIPATFIGGYLPGLQ